MNTNAVHELVKELIPFYDDIDNSAKEVINNHIQECDYCNKLFISKEDSLITPQSSEQLIAKISPFKSMINLKRLIVAIMVLSRIIILSLITTNFKISYDIHIPRSLQFDGLSANIILYYLPFSLLSLFVFWYIRNKKFLIYSFLLDALVIILFTEVVKLFF